MKLLLALTIGAVAATANPAFKNGQKLVESVSAAPITTTTTPKVHSKFQKVKDYKSAEAVEGLQKQATSFLGVDSKVHIDKNEGLQKAGFRQAQLVSDLDAHFSHLQKGESRRGHDIGTIFVETNIGPKFRPESAPTHMKQKGMKDVFDKFSLAYEKEFQKALKDVPHPSKYMNTVLLENPVDASLNADSSMISPYESITPATLNTSPNGVAVQVSHTGVVPPNPPTRPDGLALPPYVMQDGRNLGGNYEGFGLADNEGY